jgi:hypothetical protein
MEKLLKVVSLLIIWIQLFQTALFSLHFAEIEHRYSPRANDFVDFFSNGTELHVELEREDGLPVFSSGCCLEECSEEDCPAMHSLSKTFSDFFNKITERILFCSCFKNAGLFGKFSRHIFNILHLAPKNSPPQ